MIRILSIGNSFSQDAQHYLHQIAKNEGVDIACTNLYIGGCSLEQHCKNLSETGESYALEKNGVCFTGETSTILAALKSEAWDYVTLQQASRLSADFASYLPYITVLADAVRKYAPSAKLLIHQTWAYEQGSEMLEQMMGYADQHDMLRDIQKAYDLACREIQADGILPCAEAMMRAADSGLKVHRDTFHASLGVGRYLLGLVWYMTLTGKKAASGYIPLEEAASRQSLDIAKAAAEQTVFAG